MRGQSSSIGVQFDRCRTDLTMRRWLVRRQCMQCSRQCPDHLGLMGPMQILVITLLLRLARGGRTTGAALG